MADMTPFWEAEIPRLLAKVAQLSFDAVERSAEIERLRAENAEQKAEMQKLYDNWVRVLALKDTKP